LAQLLVVRPANFRVGFAQLRWGPVCQPKGKEPDGEAVQQVAQALHAEYVQKRGLFLRVLPRAWMQSPPDELLESAFSRYERDSFRSGESYRTFIVDLTPPLEIIRKRLDQKWRNQLNRAERNGLSIREGADQECFQTFFTLYDQMLARKRFASSDVRQFARIQDALPVSQRMKIFICEENGTPVAALVGTGLGNVGVYLLGATNDVGMKCKAAYLLQWRMIQWLKERGVAWYDLGGINPETNPGVYHFKKGLSGQDVQYLRPFSACGSVASKGFAAAMDLARGKGRQIVSWLTGRSR
jgi:lipid II:glycine glycyltransferase (peptidoglycan interpeptide bridge formation enzyme)